MSIEPGRCVSSCLKIDEPPLVPPRNKKKEKMLSDNRDSTRGRENP